MGRLTALHGAEFDQRLLNVMIAHQDDAVQLARTLAAQAPERCLWGTDYPHPNVREMPDDGVLVDLIEQIVPDEDARYRMLVTGPAEVADFPLEP